MKKPKIDLSKEGLQRFTLHHIEKVILALALAAFGAFLWLGISTEKYSDTDPQKLSQKATSAKTYMEKNDSWTSVDELRPARDNAQNVIRNTKPLNLKDVMFGPIRGRARRTLDVRFDPDLEIAKPFEVVANTARAPIFINKSNEAPIDDLEMARVRGQEDDDDEIGYGNQLTDLQLIEPKGLQASATGISANRHSSFVVNLAAIRALVKHSDFWKNFDEKLENSMGYFPPRDQPQYQFVEVQRKKGKDGNW
ncbi:MAG: hypothetical protein AAGA30_21720, partial [Planctomycetota bacterium]